MHTSYKKKRYKQSNTIYSYNELTARCSETGEAKRPENKMSIQKTTIDNIHHEIWYPRWIALYLSNNLKKRTKNIDILGYFQYTQYEFTQIISGKKFAANEVSNREVLKCTMLS